MITAQRSVLAWSCLLAVPTLALGQASLTGLGTNGGYGSITRGLSRDGLAVVGDYYPQGSGVPIAFRWTQATGMVSLGTFFGGQTSSAYCASANGAMVAGTSRSTGNPTVAVRWPLGQEPVLVSDYSGNAAVYAIAADGSLVVGYAYINSTTYQAAVWGPNGRAILGTLPGDATSLAYGMTSDGSVIVGASSSDPHSHAFRWTAASGMADIGTVLDSAAACAVNDDGSVIVGQTYNPITGLRHVFRWTAGDGMHDLGLLPGHTRAVLVGISADGRVAIGGSDQANVVPQVRLAMIWTPERGLQDLNAVLAARGVDMTGWSLYEARGISADGRIIAGSGTHNGHNEAYIVVLPRCGGADFDQDGDAGTDADIEAFFACLAGSCCASCGSPDFNDDGNASTDADIESFFRVLAGASC